MIVFDATEPGAKDSTFKTAKIQALRKKVSDK